MDAFHRQGFDLAQQVLADLPDNVNASIIVNACCWLLADLLLRAELTHKTDTNVALDVIVQQTAYCIDELRELTKPRPGVH